MKVEVIKKYSICVEIEPENVEAIIGAIEYFDNIRLDKGIRNHYTLFEFQKMLIAKLEEIQKNESGL